MPPRVLILRAPGTNCDGETAFAFERAGGRAETVHVNRWLGVAAAGGRVSDPVPARRLQLRRRHGGRAGSSATRFAITWPTRSRAFRDAGKLILGICNGFQVLIKRGLLDSDDARGAGRHAHLERSGRFDDRWVDLRDRRRPLRVPRRHRADVPADRPRRGQFVGRDDATLDRLEQGGQLVLRYAAAAQLRRRQPYNPNGAQRDVAGMCDASGRVFGLMPHPERYIDRTQHPQWTRLPPFDEGDGLQVFRNAVRYFQ